MGAGQSRPDTEEKVFHNEVPIEFSPDVVNQLADNLESSDTPPQRQSLIDAHIRARINSQLEALKQEEEDVRRQIEAALEKENLDKERSMAGESSAEDGGASGDVKTSATLFGDLEEVKTKIEKYHAKKDLSAHPEIQEAGNAVVECYRKNTSTSLDCWKEVEIFKASVGRLEHEYLRSL